MFNRKRSLLKKYAGVFLFLVLTKRVKVANELYSKTDLELLEAGKNYVLKFTGNSYLTTPLPTILVVSSALTEFEGLMLAAKNGDPAQTALKNAKREQVMNLLSTWSNYVEDIANDPANAEVGAAAVIDSAGMRPKPFSARKKQAWAVVRGLMPGTLFLTAAVVLRGMHEWQYTLTPTDADSWISAIPTTKASTIIGGLTSGTFVYCRHRAVTKSGVTAWEGHDPVVVG